LSARKRIQEVSHSSLSDGREQAGVCHERAVSGTVHWTTERLLAEVNSMGDVTLILSRIEAGDPTAAEELLPLVYQELRRLAAARMTDESPDHTLQATALVHEAFLRLVGSDEPQQWNGRRHFFGAAAEAMRRILVESARSKQRQKRGGGLTRVELDSACAIEPPPSLDLLAINEALNKLAVVDPAKAELVKLRYFVGLTLPEAAVAMGISLSTAERYWTFARAWLYAEMEEDSPRSSAG
jgi:RNA polymerase sigma factor (TIGR02999 family)